MPHLTLGYLTLSADPAETVTAAAKAGFKSVGIRITGRRKADPYPQVVGNRAAIRDIRNRIEDSGIRLSNISAYHFYPDVTAEDLKQVMETVQELGAGIVICNKYIPDDQQFLDLFSPYAERGQAAGVRMAIEFMKYSQATTLRHATELAEKSGCDNAGVLLDALHLERSGGTVEDIKATPADRLVFSQLCDAMRRRGDPTIEQLANEARTARLEPGKGELPLHDFLDALPPQLEIEYEVPQAGEAGMDLTERATLAYAAFRFFLDDHAAARGLSYRW